MIKYSLFYTFKAAFRVGLGKTEIKDDMIRGFITVGSKKVPVLEFNDIVWGNSGLFSICGTYTYNFKTEPAIYVDKNFSLLPSKVKAFILAHEAGHIFYNHQAKLEKEHISTLKYAFKRNFKLQKYEVEADLFAADMYGVDFAIKSLAWLSKNTSFNSSELRKRIDALKEAHLTES